MSWVWSGTIAVTCAVLGDIVGYGLGRLLGREFLERRGRWFGFTAARRTRVEMLFQQWGVLCVLLSRSLISFLSSAVNLLAGAGRYRLRVFLPFAIVGRLIWTLAYLGLGYGFAVVLEASADFLSSLSVLLLALAALAVLAFMIRTEIMRGSEPLNASLQTGPGWRKELDILGEELEIFPSDFLHTKAI